MIASWINMLNESDSRLAKEEVLTKALLMTKLGNTDAHYFLCGLRWCYNNYMTFGIKQIPSTEHLVDMENPYQEFFELLGLLATRQHTGHEARDVVAEMSLRFDSDEWNLFCAPILRRDMRSGVSEKTINKICKNTEYEVPIFSCQLATNCEGRPEMHGKKRLEPKLDGVRVLMCVTQPPSFFSEIITVCYSRNGKIFENFKHIEEQIKLVYRNIQHLVHSSNIFSSNPYQGGFYLDGEVIGNTFQELMKQARRKENVEADDSIFNIFDIIPFEDFNRGHCNAQQHKRNHVLESLKPVVSILPNVTIVDHIDVDLDTAEGKSKLDRYAKEMVDNGYEGIMIKSLDAPYECKRNTFWLKYKPVHDYDLTVIGVEQGTGKNKHRMGALVCEGIDDGKHIVVNVGSGFTDEQRDNYWEHRSDIVGKTAVVLADAITLNQNGTYSLRFPRFKTFRDDK